MQKGEKKVFDNLIYVIKYIYLWQKSIFVSIFFYSIFYGISPFIWIYVPKLLIDELTGERRVEKLLIILVGAFITSGIVGFLTEYLQGNYRMKMNSVRYNFIHLLCEKTMKMNYPYTEDPNTLDEINIAMETVQGTNKGIAAVIFKLFSIPGNVIGFLAFSAILFQLSPIILGFLIITIYLSYWIMLKAKNYERSRKEDVAKEHRENFYASITLTDFMYGKDIRVYDLKDILLTKKHASNKRLLDVTNKIQQHIFQASVIEGGLNFLRECVIYIYLIYRVIYSDLSIGNFILYAMAMNSFITWLDTTMKDIAEIKIQSLYVSDLREFLKKEEPKSKPNPTPIPVTNQYEIEFRNVTFQYPGSEGYIFKNFSLKIKPGERLAMVGVNGAGKTTLVKLLTGLYEPTNGEILINGININEFDKTKYTALYSVIFQDIKIFALNIRENITFVNREQEIEGRFDQAITMSGINDKIETLENKDETNMLKVLDQNGIELSGGENQKLAMSRALYKDGKIIIMDEPTAALDPLAEYELYKKFDNLINKRTDIYISHRLSSTRFCDAIAFIENGELKEYGTHEELMKLGKLYADMFQIQARYYKEESNVY